MILKAIIEEIIDKYSYRVRIPKYNKSGNSYDSTSSDLLNIAYVCTIPGINPQYELKDVVILGFENDLPEYPVILGRLYREQDISHVDIDCSSINVKYTATFPIETTLSNKNIVTEDIIVNLLDLLSSKTGKSSGGLEVSRVDKNLIFTEILET